MKKTELESDRSLWLSGEHDVENWENLDERPEKRRESCPDELEGWASVVVQVPEDEAGQVAQEGAQVELQLVSSHFATRGRSFEVLH